LTSFREKFGYGIKIAACVSTPILICIAAVVFLSLDSLRHIKTGLPGSAKLFDIPLVFLFLVVVVAAIPASVSAIFLDMWLKQSKRMAWRDFVVGGFIGAATTLLCAAAIAAMVNQKFGTIEHWLVPASIGFYFGSFGTLIHLYLLNRKKQRAVT
jgi:ABC-type multidrug transport system fused ATPase/permease subunit